MSEEIVKVETNNTSETDLSKIKIRHILWQRFKECGYKKIIGIILLVVISFGGGILTDRFIIRHAVGNRFYGRPGIQRNFRRGFNNNSFSNDTQSQGSTQTPSQKQ